MNRIIIFIILLPIHTHIGCSEVIPATTLAHAMIDKNNQPTPALLKLLERNQCLHDGTLSSIATSAQKLLRPSTKERWESNTNKLPDANDMLLFKQLYLIQEIVPTQKSYDYALLLGGVLDDVHNRLEYLIDIWDKGTRFKSLVILTGKRLLDPQIEGKESLLRHNSKHLPLPTTEPEMIKFILAQTDTPKEWKKIPFIFIDTPMQKDGYSYRRPNTEDTIRKWLQERTPCHGKVLLISNQPFAGYQNAVGRKNLPGFFIETVGSAYTNNESLATMLDTVARQVYNESLIIHSQQLAKY